MMSIARANLGDSKHILDPRTDFSTGENSVYRFGSLQKTLSVGFEALSAPATTHFAVTALGISQGGLDGKSGWVIWVCCREGEGSEKGNDRVELYS